MKPKCDEKYLVTESEGYACYMFPVNEETMALALYLRGLHKDRLHGAGYEGYSEIFDEHYHLNGIYLYVETQGVVAATLRMNKRSSGLIFPFEIARTDDGVRHEYKDQDLAIDINTYCLDKRFYKKATQLIVSAAASYIAKEGIKRAFGLYDVKNKATKSLYHKLGFFDSEQYPQPIFFDTFTHQDSKEPVRWRILEWKVIDVQEYKDTFG